jgi:hypothetical protein
MNYPQLAFLLAVTVVAVAGANFFSALIARSLGQVPDPPEAGGLQSVPVHRDEFGNYVVLVLERDWPVFSQVVARGSRDYGIDRTEFVEMPSVVRVLSANGPK